MPRLACLSCGRQIYTVSPLDSLFAEERRCPRCGAFLSPERRATDRRSYLRRQSTTDGAAFRGDSDRRHGDRRQTTRRRVVAA